MAPRDEELFLFVNPTSGGNRGRDFLRVPQPFETQLEDGRKATLHIYSLISNASEGFQKFKAVADSASHPIRMIVGGGDGTVMWADSEATKHGIDTARQCIFGIVPLGTGNDFSRVAGWGGKNPKRILSHDCEKLRIMVQLWCKASTRPHDVWQVKAEVDEEGGSILKVSKERKETELPNKARSFTLPMINYFSVGQESKVGMEFDKHRTKSQTCNLLVYAWEGLFATCDCMGQQQKVADLISALHAGADDSAPIIFEGRGEDEDESDEEEAKTLVGNPESLMFLNVNSYAGGAAQFWQRHSELATEPEPHPKDVDVEAHPGDGRLEVVTLPSIVNIALDRVSHDAKRVHSGSAYYMEFFAAEQKSTLDAYCEVDGEFYHLVNPHSVSVRFLKKLQVLQNDDPGRNVLKRLLDSGRARAKEKAHELEEKLEATRERAFSKDRVVSSAKRER